MYAICETEECENQGKPIDIGDTTSVDEVTGETRTITEVACGPCGQPITNLVERAVDPFEEEEAVG